MEKVNVITNFTTKIYKLNNIINTIFNYFFFFYLKYISL